MIFHREMSTAPFQLNHLAEFSCVRIFQTLHVIEFIWASHGGVLPFVPNTFYFKLMTQ